MQEETKLVAIGYLGTYLVYVGLTKEDAMRRHDEENPDWRIADWGLSVQEVTTKHGVFRAYEISEID